MENENEIIDSSIDTETTENEVVEDQFEETTPEIDVVALQKENATLKAQKEHWKKKAEAPKETKSETSSDGLTAKDVLILTGSGISNVEDVELAQKFAKVNGTSVAEAIKDPDFQSALARRKEERTTAQVTQTKGGARAVTRNTGEEILKRAERGEYPESEEDINKMLEAKFERRKSKK